MTEQAKATSRARGARCPVCGKETREAYRPFCSRRCADIDLARWLSGTYVIEGGSADADEDGDGAAATRSGRPEADDPETGKT
jgi:endogenous inhibitor of DNA gyrase (YacG/DUF329 family)